MYLTTKEVARRSDRDADIVKTRLAVGPRARRLSVWPDALFLQSSHISGLRDKPWQGNGAIFSITPAIRLIQDSPNWDQTTTLMSID